MANQRVSPGRLASPEASVFAAHFPANIIRRSHPADLFQRSSSCVEGRNGQLSLRHHHLHQLSPRKLKVLTILHNYLIRRPDGTTAAERFFGAKPQDLFEDVLDRLDVPARPAAPRSTRKRSAA